MWCVDVSGVSRSRVTPSWGATRAAPSPRPAGERAAPAGGHGASEQVRGRSSLDAVLLAWSNKGLYNQVMTRFLIKVFKKSLKVAKEAVRKPWNNVEVNYDQLNRIYDIWSLLLHTFFRNEDRLCTVWPLGTSSLHPAAQWLSQWWRWWLDLLWRFVQHIAGVSWAAGLYWWKTS